MSAEKDMSRTSADQPPSELQMRMRLTAEESRILQECNKESFYYRSAPLAVAAMAATHIAVNKGFLKANPRWGSTLKVIGAGFVGWFIGKISYRSVCEEKFLNLQNSPLADVIRKRRGYRSETLKDGSPSNEILLHADDAPSYSLDDDFTSSSRSLNLDTDKNIQYSGLDDRPTGGEYDVQPEETPQKFSTTYEDLRRKNREEYELRQSKLYQPSSSSSSVPSSSSASRDWRSVEDKPSSWQSSSYHPERSGMQNAYGDRWDK